MVVLYVRGLSIGTATDADALVAACRAQNERVDVCDEAGNRLGTFTPEPAAADAARLPLPSDTDPLMRWAGAIDSGAHADWVERHDYYLGLAALDTHDTDTP